MDQVRVIFLIWFDWKMFRPNKFSDEKSCDMFLLVLNQKWSEFRAGLSGGCTVEIVRGSNVARCMSAILTFEYLDNCLLISEWAEE